MIPGETILSGAPNPKNLPFIVCRSNAGYYIGTYDIELGPYSRETDYFKSNNDAETALTIYKNTGFLAKRRM